MADTFVNAEGFDIELAAGVKPMNNLDFELMQDHHILVAFQKKRLDAVLQDLWNRSDSASLTERVTAVETKANGNASAITALQEKDAALQTAIDAKAAINDTAASATSVYSSTKTEDLITAAKQAVKNELLDGVGTEMDTLKEVAAAIKDNKDALAALQTVAAGHIKYDSAQSLTDAQKSQARSNIDAVSSVQLATKLDGTVAKTAADDAAVNLDTLTAEGEFLVPKANGRPSGVSDAYQNLFVSVRKSGAAIEQVVRGIENGAGRVFIRTGTIADDGSVTFVAWNEVGSKQDLSSFATKTEVQAASKLAQQGVDDAATAKLAADAAQGAAATAQNTANGAVEKANANEKAIGALGALAHKNKVAPEDLADSFDLGSI